MTPRLILTFAISLLAWAAASALADPVPIDCDPATTCKPIDPCALAPERCSQPTPPLTHCRKGICVQTEDQCVPGCDPPDENNTIHGCSSCYSTKSVCVRWEEVCD